MAKHNFTVFQRLLIELCLSSVLLGLASCSSHSKIATAPSSAETPSDSVQIPTESSPAPSAFPETEAPDPTVTVEYLTDTEIPTGDSADILVSRGILRETAFPDLLTGGGWILGADEAGNILILDTPSNEIRSVATDGSYRTLATDLMAGKDGGYCTAVWDGGKWVAWSTTPYYDPATDETHGADWKLYLLNLETGEIILVDEDDGLEAVEGDETYRAPGTVAIGDGYLAYNTFVPREDGMNVQGIKLYSIASRELQTIYVLQGNPLENQLGDPSIGDGKCCFAQAEITPSYQYIGYSLEFNLAEEQIWRVETEENLINPVAAGGFLFAENHPNTTFYNSEIVAMDCGTHTWRYKITSNYPGYERKDGVCLGAVSSWGNYVSWNATIVKTILVFQTEEEKLYPIPTQTTANDLQNIHLLPGGLMTWNEWYIDEDGNYTPAWCYCMLKCI